jgi:2,3-dihydroxybenzoate decarboxylase
MNNKIAVEEHFFTSELGAIINDWKDKYHFPDMMDEEFIRKGLPLTGLPFDDHRIPTMDECGVQIQILSTNSPGIQGIENAAKAVDVAKRTNDAAAELIAKYPNRFAGFAALPLQNPQASVRELERCVKELGFRGAMIQGHCNFEYLDNEKFDDIWSCLEALDVPLSLHVFNPWPDQIRIYEGFHEMLGPTWNWGVEAATHTLRIIFGGVFERHPGARMILGHLGESLPYLLGRIDEGAKMTGALKKGRISNPPSYYLKTNVYVSTSGQYRPETLLCAIAALGIEKILFATDYPYVEMSAAVDCVESTLLTEDQRKAIYRENAAQLFNL